MSYIAGTGWAWFSACCWNISSSCRSRSSSTTRSACQRRGGGAGRGVRPSRSGGHGGRVWPSRMPGLGTGPDHAAVAGPVQRHAGDSRAAASIIARRRRHRRVRRDVPRPVSADLRGCRPRQGAEDGRPSGRQHDAGALLGSSYVNDYDPLRHIYKVYIQAEPSSSRIRSGSVLFFVRSAAGRIVPAGCATSTDRPAGPDSRPAQPVALQDVRRAGAQLQLAQRLAELEEVAEGRTAGSRRCSRPICRTRKGLARSRCQFFGLAVLLVFLVLAAQLRAGAPFMCSARRCPPSARFSACGWQAPGPVVDDVLRRIG